MCRDGASAGPARAVLVRGESRAGPGRARLGPLGPLVAGGLVVVEDADRLALTRALRVPDRVVAHPWRRHRGSRDRAAARRDRHGGHRRRRMLARAIAGGVPLVYIRERSGASGSSLTRAALARLGRPAVELDLNRLGPADEPRTIAAAARARGRTAGRRAGSSGRSSRWSSRARLPSGRSRSRGRGSCSSGNRLGSGLGAEPPLLLDAPVSTVAERHELWLSSLNGATPIGFDPAIVTLAFRLAPQQIRALRRPPTVPSNVPTG